MKLAFRGSMMKSLQGENFAGSASKQRGPSLFVLNGYYSVGKRSTARSRLNGGFSDDQQPCVMAATIFAWGDGGGNWTEKDVFARNVTKPTAL